MGAKVAQNFLLCSRAPSLLRGFVLLIKLEQREEMFASFCAPARSARGRPAIMFVIIRMLAAPSLAILAHPSLVLGIALEPVALIQTLSLRLARLATTSKLSFTHGGIRHKRLLTNEAEFLWLRCGRGQSGDRLVPQTSTRS